MTYQNDIQFIFRMTMNRLLGKLTFTQQYVGPLRTMPNIRRDTIFKYLSIFLEGIQFMEISKQNIILNSYAWFATLYRRTKRLSQLVLVFATTIFLATGCAGYGGTASDVAMAARDRQEMAAYQGDSNQDIRQENSAIVSEDTEQLQDDISDDKILLSLYGSNPFIANLLYGDIALAESAIASLQAIIYVN